MQPSKNIQSPRQHSHQQTHTNLNDYAGALGCLSTTQYDARDAHRFLDAVGFAFSAHRGCGRMVGGYRPRAETDEP